jgi:hypothetical protein
MIAGPSGWAMWQEVAASRHVRTRGTGIDFATTTWHAARGLLARQDVYATSTRIAGIGQLTPAGEHVPATLLWQSPFAALPLWPGFFAFDAASIAAIWAAVFILTRPRSPQAVVLTACCGAFAILSGAGEWTLLMGQPAGFELLGIAMVVRARRPWVAAVGFLLAASTFQTGVPLALALTMLGARAVVWRGALMTVACSLPPVVLGMSAARGPASYTRVFALGAFGHLATLPGQPRGLAEQPNRIDLGALLLRAGIHSTGVQIAVGALMLALALSFLARLPTGLRRLDYPPVLCLVIAVSILCCYHQPYDVLLVAGAVIPVALLAGSRSAPMFAVAIAGILCADIPAAVILDSICLGAIAVLSVLAARWGAAPSASGWPVLTEDKGGILLVRGGFTPTAHQ